LMEQRVPLTVVLSGGLEFKDMMITSHSSPRVSGRGGSIRVRMDLQQIITADAALTVKGSQTRADPAVKPEKAKGNQGAKTPKSKQQAILDRLIRQGNLQPPGTR